MSIVAVRAALETKLAAILPALATAYENVLFTPVAGTPYQACFTMPAMPENPTMGDSYYREQGIFQVSLFYPIMVGSAVVAARAEIVRDAFRRGSTFVGWDNYFLSERVIVPSTPHIGQGRVDGDRWHVPVKIQWYVEIT